MLPSGCRRRANTQTHTTRNTQAREGNAKLTPPHARPRKAARSALSVLLVKRDLAAAPADGCGASRAGGGGGGGARARGGGNLARALATASLCNGAPRPPRPRTGTSSASSCAASCPKTGCRYPSARRARGSGGRGVDGDARRRRGRLPPQRTRGDWRHRRNKSGTRNATAKRARSERSTSTHGGCR